MTPRDIIKGAMRLIGATAQGENPTAAEEADALLVLNDMIEGWNLERLMVFTISQQEFNLVAGQQSYTMGSGGNFNTVRPVRIEQAYIRVTSTTPNVDLPLEMLEDDQWAAITIKSTTSTIPTRIYNQNGYPLITLNLWPVPSVTSKLILYTWGPLTSFTSLSQNVSLPPGYSKALRYNLALELGPEYGRQPEPTVAAMALQAKEDIKRVNITPVDLFCDAATLSEHRTFNYLTGE